MPEITHYAPGMFCWFELGTSDAEAAKKFYGELFGWTANDMPAGPDMIYTMLQRDEKDVGALYQLTEEHKSKGVPPHWLPYICVASADESAAKATELGGTVAMGPIDVFDAGRMAVVADPTGAVFAIWQPASSIGAKLRDEPYTLCWNELWTSDTTKAVEFYTKLFGWATKLGDMGPMVYTELMNDGKPIGGMLPITPEMGEVPPHWLGYIRVEDCDVTADKAKTLGADIKLPPTDIPNVGRFAVIQDPQGATFAIIKLTQPA
jgi:predicted enzyme related to lactoylglutathione lyase